MSRFKSWLRKWYDPMGWLNEQLAESARRCNCETPILEAGWIGRFDGDRVHVTTFRCPVHPEVPQRHTVISTAENNAIAFGRARA